MPHLGITFGYVIYNWDQIEKAGFRVSLVFLAAGIQSHSGPNDMRINVYN